MKKLILIFAVLALYSCVNLPEANVVKKSTGEIVDYEYSPIEIVTIDSCEYIYGAWGYATVLTHKGNCKNHK